MTFTVTGAQVLRLNPKLGSSSDAIAASINDAAALAGINATQRRLRYFVAQTFFESARFTQWSENLYYSDPNRLVVVWPSRFTCDQNACTATRVWAPDYVKNPMKLGSFVYANRNGNGDVSTGDGYTFRGRGALQLTGRSNYSGYSQFRYQDDRIVTNPDAVAAPEDAFGSSAWYWKNNNLNALADTDSFTQCTRVINGSTATVPARLQVLNLVNSIVTG